MAVFGSFDVLIPKAQWLPLWPVIACDQFTSQPEYWEKMHALVGDKVSALHCILPEAELKSSDDHCYDTIRATMKRYLQDEVFYTYPNAFVYVERTLLDGSIRRGIVGAIDLETYDYHSDAQSAIRATERTVEERIPPRMKVRRGAAIELSHVLLLCDDEHDCLIGPLTADPGNKLYELDLPQGGGHIRGWLIDGPRAQALQKRIDQYCADTSGKYQDKAPMLFAVGDGNHSLATAKECYEELKRTTSDAEAIHRARYAVVELENIRDDAQRFEPIHRLVSDVEPAVLIDYLRSQCCADEGYPIQWYSGEQQGVLYLDPAKGVLPIGILQSALDEYLLHQKGNIDYIHGLDALRDLSRKQHAIGFELPSIPKNDFFRGIARDGVFPRKTFSMGEAQEKRYYLEARAL